MDYKQTTKFVYSRKMPWKKGVNKTGRIYRICTFMSREFSPFEGKNIQLDFTLEGSYNLTAEALGWEDLYRL